MSEFSDHLLQFWDNAPSGRILITNVVNQLDMGILTPEKVTSFLERIRVGGPHLRNAEAFMSSEGSASFSAEQMGFLGPCALGNEALGPLVRVTTMREIVDNCTPYDENVPTLRALADGLAELLNVIEDLSLDESEVEGAEKDLDDLLSEAASIAPVPETLLRTARPERHVVAARLVERTVKLRAPSDHPPPTFCTPLNCSETPLQPLASVRRPMDALDVRAGLGLDFLSPRYMDRRTTLGFIVFSPTDLEVGGVRRPTPFDGASLFRFRSAHGVPVGRHAVKDWGRTVDLQRLESDGVPGAGHREFVVSGTTLKSGAVIGIGYLGRIRDDAVGQHSRDADPDSHKGFLKACLGGGNPPKEKEDVFETLRGLVS